MTRRLLLIYFATWLPDQQSNSDDDLLIELTKLDSISHALTLVRSLPMDVQLAKTQVLEKTVEPWPYGIICCGMTQKQVQLRVESNAALSQTVLSTTVNLKQLVVKTGILRLAMTAANLSVKGLNYSVLDDLRQSQLKIPCTFIRVSILTTKNLPSILADFLLIIHSVAL